MSPEDVEVHYLTEEDLHDALQHALGEAGMTLDELKAEAKSGVFSSETARWSWFTVSWVLECLEAA
jgi:hypothetical protein